MNKCLICKKLTNNLKYCSRKCAGLANCFKKGHIVTTETRLKISEANIVNNKWQGDSNPMRDSMLKLQIIKTRRNNGSYIISKVTKKKMSKARKGKIPWNKDKLCPQLSGENSGFWRGGIVSKIERLRGNTYYNNWKNNIYKRDDNICQMCNSKCSSRNKVAHHIKNFKEYPKLRYEVSNGILLCRSCHAKIHKGNLNIKLCNYQKSTIK